MLAMSTEMNKSVPNPAILEDRMTRTLAARRQAVIQKPLLELLSDYPALKLDDQVQRIQFISVTYCRRYGLEMIMVWEWKVQKEVQEENLNGDKGTNLQELQMIEVIYTKIVYALVNVVSI